MDNQTTNLQQNMDDQKGIDDVVVLQNRISELENNWKRALADYKNLEKRVNEERYQFLEFANSTLILRMLPILDNLEMLEKHNKDMGLSLTIKEFKQILKDENVIEIEATDTDFDAATMEAVEMVDGPKDKIIELLRKGYLFKERLLRPARVRVGKGN